VGDRRPICGPARGRRQRRRRRARHDQGPLRHGAAAVPPAGGHGDRGAVRRGRPPAHVCWQRSTSSVGRGCSGRCPWRS
jgi:hypothetical protein